MHMNQEEEGEALTPPGMQSRDSIIGRRTQEEAEALIAALPGMRKSSQHNGPYDFLFASRNEKIEHKFRNSDFIDHNQTVTGEYTIRFLWGDIARRDFDWLLLSGK
jgi:hypothetical protein